MLGIGNCVAAAVAVSLLPAVLGHGAVVIPPPRSAVDKDLLPWSGPVPPVPPSVESGTGWAALTLSINFVHRQSLKDI